MLKKISLLLATAVSLFAFHSADININNKDLEVGLKLDMGQFNDTVEPGTTFLGFSYLKPSNEHSMDNADVHGYYEVNFLIRQYISDTDIYGGIGVKANFATVSIGGDKSYTTIPLGVEAGYTFPLEIPITLGGEIYFAPESLAFSDAESFLEYRAEVTVELIERGSVFIGYRNIDTNYEFNTNKIKVNLNKSAYFGFRFQF